MSHKYFKYVHRTSFNDGTRSVHCKVCSHCSYVRMPVRAAALLLQRQHCLRRCEVRAAASHRLSRPVGAVAALPRRQTAPSRGCRGGGVPGSAALTVPPRYRSLTPKRQEFVPPQGDSGTRPAPAAARTRRTAAARPCPHPAGDCGHPGALPAPAPDPRALTRAARGQAGPQPPFPVHQHHPRRRPAPRACALPFGASWPHPTSRGARITCVPAR